MEPLHIKCLRDKRVFLLDHLRPDEVLDYLVQENVITPHEESVIRSERVVRYQTKAMLDKLSSSGPQAFAIFRTALIQTKQEFISEELQRKLDGMEPHQEPGSTMRAAVGDASAGVPWVVVKGLKLCAQLDLTERVPALLDGYDLIEAGKVQFCGCPLLFIAAEHGSLNMVKYLVEQCSANLEQPGHYEQRGDTRWASPLYMASKTNRVDVVKYLVGKGASVNAVNDYGVTCVMAACFGNYVEEVKYLTENGADINQADNRGETCLMWASKSPELVRYLLEKNADVDAQTKDGRTALHFASTRNSPHQAEVLKLLIEHKANMSKKTRYGDDAIRWASLEGLPDTVALLLKAARSDKEKEIEAQELLGCYYLDVKDDAERALDFWQQAYNNRIEHSIPISEKSHQSPLSKEVEQIKSLGDLKKKPDRIQLFSLLRRERILGTDHPQVLHFCLGRGAFYAHKGNYEQSILLLGYCLELLHKRHRGTDGPLNEKCVAAVFLSTGIFGEMKTKGITKHLTFSNLFLVFQIACNEVQRVKNDMNARTLKKEDVGNVEKIMCSTLHLIRLLLESDMDREQQRQLDDTARVLMSADIKDMKGRYLLDLARLESTSKVDGRYLSKFPCHAVDTYLSEIHER